MVELARRHCRCVVLRHHEDGVPTGAGTHRRRIMEHRAPDAVVDVEAPPVAGGRAFHDRLSPTACTSVVVVVVVSSGSVVVVVVSWAPSWLSRAAWWWPRPSSWLRVPRSPTSRLLRAVGATLDDACGGGRRRGSRRRCFARRRQAGDGQPPTSRMPTPRRPSAGVRQAIKVVAIKASGQRGRTGDGEQTDVHGPHHQTARDFAPLCQVGDAAQRHHPSTTAICRRSRHRRRQRRHFPATGPRVGDRPARGASAPSGGRRRVAPAASRRRAAARCRASGVSRPVKVFAG